MPIVVDRERELLASCRDGLCPGYAQVPVRGIEREAAFTYGELGGGRSSTPQEEMVARLPERSTVQYVWADPADEPCPSCGRARIIDPNPRPVYEAKTGQDPLLLRKRELGLDKEGDDRRIALDLQREQLDEAKRANDLREREIRLRERELKRAKGNGNGAGGPSDGEAPV